MIFMRGLSAIVVTLIILLIGVMLIFFLYNIVYNVNTSLQSAAGNKTENYQRQIGSKIEIVDFIIGGEGDITCESGIKTIPISFTVVNSGSYDLENFTVYVNNILQTPVRVPSVLKPGETAQIIVAAKIPEAENVVDVTIATPYVSVSRHFDGLTCPP
jgi:archaellum component FlaF (FlaF/FlaG flagellin family)